MFVAADLCDQIALYLIAFNVNARICCELLRWSAVAEQELQAKWH